MLSAHDLCPDDPLAKGLLAAFDPATLVRAIARARPDLNVASARIERAKYKPYSKALLSLRVTGANGDATFLALRVLPAKGVKKQYKAALAKASSVACAPTLLPELNAVSWRFPHDYKMPALPNLADPVRLENEALPELIASLAPGAKLEKCATEVAHYAAEQSCALRVTLRLRRATGDIEHRTLYAKHHADGEEGQAETALKQIASANRAYGVARILLTQPHLGIQWQEVANGRPIDINSILRQQDNLISRVAAATAGLHDTPSKLREVVDATSLPRLRQRLRVASMLPASAIRRIEACLQGLEQSRPMLCGPLLLAHGDLHPKNIFDDGQQVTFIDFDAARLALREHDVASFSAALIYHGLLTGFSGEQISAALRAWTGAYRRAAGRLDRPLLHWLSAYCLLDERLYRCLTRLKPGRRAVALRLIDWAEDALAQVADFRGVASA